MLGLNFSRFFRAKKNQPIRKGKSKVEKRSRLNAEQLEDRLVPANFTPTNLAVLEAANTTSDTTGSILEINPSSPGSVVQTVPVNNVLISGGAGTVGYLADSANGTLLTLSGYETGTSPSNVNVIPQRYAVAFDYTTAQTLGAQYYDPGAASNTNTARSAATFDGSTYYIADQGGLYTNNVSANSGTYTTALEAMKPFGSTMYEGSKSTPGAVEIVPSANSTSLTPLTGIGADSSFSDFYLVSSGANGSTYDVMYTLDSTGAINKFYSSNGTTWTAAGSYTGLSGGDRMAAEWNGSGVTLFVTDTGAGDANNNLIELTDNSTWNGNINVTTADNTTLYSATGGASLYGVAFVPVSGGNTLTQAAPPTFSPSSVTIGQSVMLSDVVTAAEGSTAPPAGSVAFYNNGTLLATATSEMTSDNQATFSVASTTLPVGTYSNIIAVYSPGGGFSASTSTPASGTLTVSGINTTAAAPTFTPTTVTTAQTVTFSDVVTAGSGSTAPTAGTVTFMNGSTVLATATTETTSETQATFSVTISASTIPIGTYNDVTAVYSGNGNFDPSSASSPSSGTLTVNGIAVPAGTIAQWTFENYSTTADTLTNNPAPSYGAGTASSIGMAATVPIASITESGTTATLTLASPMFGPTSGTVKLLLAGNSPSAYNGQFTCTVTGSSTATFTAPSGTGTATTVGTATGYGTPNVGVTTDDVTQGASGDTGTNGVADLTNYWRVRAQAGSNGAANGWSSLAPIGTQGAQFQVSTLNDGGPITVTFDWYATSPGEAHMMLEYTDDDNVANPTWNNVEVTVPAADFANGAGPVAVDNTNPSDTNTVQGWYVNLAGGTGGQDWAPGLTATINDPNAANNPYFAVEMVNASTGADCVNTTGGALNNSSGNWRFDNITFQAQTPNFTAGNLVLLQAGNSTNTYSQGPVYLNEVTPAGASVQQIGVSSSSGATGIAAATETGTTVTVTTTTSAVYAVGESITLSGIVSGSGSGASDWDITEPVATVISPTQFTIQAPASLPAITSLTGAMTTPPNQPLTVGLDQAVGNAQLNRSYDGSALTFNGVDSPTEPTSAGNTPYSTDDRDLAVVSGNPNYPSDINTSTYGAWNGGDDNRDSVAESAYGPIYQAGHNNDVSGFPSYVGVHEFSTEGGPSLGTQVSAASNIRGVTIGPDNREYFSTAAGDSSVSDLAGIFTDAAALPASGSATPSQDIEVVPSLITNDKLNGVYIADMNGTGVISNGDRLYFVSDGSEGGAGTGGLYVATWNTSNDYAWDTPNNAGAAAAGILDYWGVPVRLGDAPVQTGSASVGAMVGVTGTVLNLPSTIVNATATWSSNVATITLSSAPQFSVGQSVTISGMTPAAYNGTFVVTAVSGDTFSYALSESSSRGAGTGGTVSAQGTVELYTTAFDNAADDSSIVQQWMDQGSGVTVTSAQETGNTVTITTASATNFTTGEYVTVDGVGTTGGSTYAITGAPGLTAGYNGTFLVTVVNSTTFTYTDTASSLASVSNAGGVGSADAAVTSDLSQANTYQSFGIGINGSNSGNYNSLAETFGGSIVETLANGTETVGTKTVAQEGLRGVAFAPVAATNITLANNSGTLTATLTNNEAPLSGEVAFINENTGAVLGYGTISESAPYVYTATLSAGTVVGDAYVEAYFAGGGSLALAPAQSNIIQVQNAGTTADSVSITATPTAVAVNKSVTLTATVTPSTGPTGNVSFYNTTGGALPSLSNLIGTVALTGNTASLTTAFGSTGAQTIIAVYNGDATYEASSSTAATVTVATNATAAITPSANNVALGSSPSYTVNLTGNATLGAPAGSVTVTIVSATENTSGHPVLSQTSSSITLTASGNNSSATWTGPALTTPGSYLVTMTYTPAGGSGYSGFSITTESSGANYTNTALIENVVQAFTPGNLVVVQRGDGSVNTGSSGGLVELDEYTPGGTEVQSIVLPNSTSGSNNAFVLGSQNGSQGLINRSANGADLTLIGYDTELGTQFLTSSFPSTIARTIAEVGSGAAGAINTSTAITSSTTPVPFEEEDVVSNDGNEFWIVSALPTGDTTDSGIEYVSSVGATTATQLTAGGTTGSAITIAGGQLYTTGGSGNIDAVGTGLPTTAAQTITSLPNLQNEYENYYDAPGSGRAPEQVLLLNTIDGTTNNPNVAYVADQDYGLLKFYLNNVSIGLTSSGTTATATVTSGSLSFLMNGNDQVQITGVPGYNGIYTLPAADISGSGGPGTTFTFTTTGSNLASAPSGGTAGQWLSGDDGTGIFGQKLIFAGGATGVTGNVTFNSMGQYTGVQLYVSGSSTQGSNPNELVSLDDTNPASAGFPSGNVSLEAVVGASGTNPTGTGGASVSNANADFAGIAFVPGYVTNTALTSTAASVQYNTSSYSTPITYTATVTSTGAGDTPAGTVLFYNGSTLLATESITTVSGHQEATFTTSAAALGLSVGSYTITATYNPGGQELALDDMSSGTTPLNVDYTPGDVLATLVGTGTTLTSSGTATSVVDITPGSGVNSGNTVTLPSTGSGAVTEGGTATTQGLLTDSGDSQSVSLAGYTVAAGSSTSGANAAIAVISPDGALNTSTIIPVADTGVNGSSSNTVKATASADGLGFYVATNDYIQYVPLGNSASTPTTTIENFFTANDGTSGGFQSSQSPNDVAIADGQLYGDAGSEAQTDGVPADDGPFTVGSGLPTTAGQSATALDPSTATTNAVNTAGFSTAEYGTPEAFLTSEQFSVSPDGNTIIVADARTNGDGGVYMYEDYTFTGTWDIVAEQTYASTGLTGLAVNWSNPQAPVIYAVTTNTNTGNGANSIVSFAASDTGNAGSGNVGSIPAPTTVATAPTNESFRGVALAPVAPGTAATTTMLSVTNNSGPYSQVTLTATVTGSSPTGYVSFRNNGVEIGSAPVVNGVATLTPDSNFLAGSYTNLTAVYTGDANNAPSTSTPAISATVAKYTTTEIVSDSGDGTGITGTPDTITVSLQVPAGTSPTGTVMFYDGVPGSGGVQIGTTQNIAQVISGGAISFKASINYAFPIADGGTTQDIYAVYSGDSNFAGVTNPSPGYPINVINGTTTFLTSNNNNPSGNGGMVTFTATVTGNTTAGAPAGSVQFYINGVAIGSPVTLTQGSGDSSTAQLNETDSLTETAPGALTPGVDSISAVYSGETSPASYGTSSGVLNQTVQASPLTAGDTLVYQVGDTTTTNFNSGDAFNENVVYIDEYTPSGALVEQIVMPSVTANGFYALTQQTDNGTAGFLNQTVSGNGYVFGGVDYGLGAIPSGTTAPASIAFLSNSGTVTIDTVDTANQGYQLRSVASVNGSSFYEGTSNGVYYIPAGTDGAAVALSATLTGRNVLIAPAPTGGDQLYISSGTAADDGVATVGTGLPTTTGQTVTQLSSTMTTEIGASFGPYDYKFAELDPADGYAVDTLYILNDSTGATGGVQKWTYASGAWSYTSNNTASESGAGEETALAVSVSGGVATISVMGDTQFAATAGGQVATLTDSSGYGAAPGYNSATFMNAPITLGESAPSNTSWHGDAFVAVATQTVVTSNVADAAASGASITFTATVTTTNDGGATPTGSVQFYDGLVPLGSPVALNGSGVATLTVTTSLLQQSGLYITPGIDSITVAGDFDGDYNAGSGLAVSGVLNQVVQAQAFGAGDQLVYRVGDGTTPLTSYSGTAAVFVDEYTSSGTLVQSIAMPTADGVGSDGNYYHALVQISSGASNPGQFAGQITVSGNGVFDFLTGYDDNPMTAANAATDNALRSIARISANGTIQIMTINNATVTPGSFNSDITGVYSPDGNQVWVDGTEDFGLMYVSTWQPGQTTIAATQVISGVTGSAFINELGLESNSGNLYMAVTSDSPTPFESIFNLGSLSSLTTAGAISASALTNSVELLTTHKYYTDVYFASPTLMYVAYESGSSTNAYGNGGIAKYEYNGSAWVLEGTAITGSTTLSGTTPTGGDPGFVYLSGTGGPGNVTLYLTYTYQGAIASGVTALTGKVYSLQDTNGATSGFSSTTPTSIVTETTGSSYVGEELHGIAAVPVKATPTITTSANPTTVTVGGTISDTATVSGGYDPTGSVTFDLYNNNTASGSPLFTDTETLVSGSATSASYTTAATGTDYWVATYSGDGNNISVSSGDASEPVIVNPSSTPVTITSWVVNGAPVTVNGVQYNWSALGQRSMVDNILVTFNQPVSLADADGDFVITPQSVTVGRSHVTEGTTPQLDVFGYGSPTVINSVDYYTSYEITFVNGVDGVAGNSIANGVYSLNIVNTDVAGSTGGALAAQSNQVFYRLFGDTNGTTATSNGTLNTGTATVGSGDVSAFDAAFATTNSGRGASAAYVSYLDADASGSVDTTAAGDFDADFGVTWSGFTATI